MSHPLLNRIRAVGRSSRRLLLLYAVSCVMALVLAVGFSLGLTDYLVRFSDPGVRWLCFAAMAVVSVLAVYFFMLPVVRFRRSEIQIAKHIEQRFPMLGDQLSSTVAFLAQGEGDASAGSSQLRRLVIADTTARVEQVDLAETINRRAPLRALALACLAGAVTMGAFVLAPASSTLAARRLLAPWNDEAWPPRNELEFIEPPAKLALGSDLQLELRDRNQRLSSQVFFEYRYKGEQKVHAKPMKLNHSTMCYSFQLTNVDRSLEFRASGGDDVTNWRTLSVVEPVRITKLRVKTIPPVYAGWTAEESDGHIRALVGSRVELHAEVSKPLARAVIKFDDNLGETEIPVRLSEDGLTLAAGGKQPAPWVVRTSGRYRIEMTEREDPVDATAPEFEVRAVVDNPPKVILDEPGKHSYVTRNAVLALRGVVEDDLAIASVDLEYWNDAESAEPPRTYSVELYRQPAEAELPSNGSDSQHVADGVLIGHDWDLGNVQWLRAGIVVSFRIAARDFRPQEGPFVARQLSIITVEQLLDRIGRKQSSVLQQLAEALRAQREVNTDVAATRLQLSGEPQVDASLMDQVQSAELRQRQVQRILADNHDGVTVTLENLVHQVDINRVDDEEVRASLLDMIAELRRIDREHLTLVQRHFVQAIELTRQLVQDRLVDGTDAAPLRETISSVEEQQDLVIASLERMIGQLSQWDSFQRVARDLRYLRTQQEELAADTEKHRLATIGKDYRNLSSQQRTELSKLGLKQSVIGRQFEKLVAGMARMRDDMAEAEPLVSRAIDDAIETARRLGISTELRDAASAVKDNRIATAVRLQQRSIEELREMLDVLSNRRENKLGRRLKQLQQAAGDLERLREEVASLGEQLKNADSLTDSQQKQNALERLRKQRAEKAGELDRLARRLQRLQAQRAADTTSKAGEALGQSDNSDKAASQRRENLEKSKELLDQAQRELEQELGKIQQQLAREQMVKLEQQINGLAARQATLLERTERLNQVETNKGSLSRAQQHTVLEMSREQRTLALEVSGLSANLAQSEIFRLGLSGAAREMLRAASRLGRSELGNATQQNEQAALRRLQQLVEALKQDSAEPAESEAPEPTELGDLAPEQAVRLLAELKLLRLMQSEIHQRTIELEKHRKGSGKPLSEEVKQQLRELAGEQGRLADLMLNLSQPRRVKPEDDPASLPGPNETK